MEILYLLIPLALVLIAFAALFWAIKNGQYEDLEGPAYRTLMDDDEQPMGDRKQEERKQ